MIRVGSGCATCPAYGVCGTMLYRGSRCQENRERFGLGDPFTNADRIRAMSDEELVKEFIFYNDDLDRYETHTGVWDTKEEAIAEELKWLQQPAEEVQQS